MTEHAGPEYIPLTVVIGHRNPDTDSFASATGYAELKRLRGSNNVVAGCAGPAGARVEGRAAEIERAEAAERALAAEIEGAEAALATLERDVPKSMATTLPASSAASTCACVRGRFNRIAISLTSAGRPQPLSSNNRRVSST